MKVRTQNIVDAVISFLDLLIHPKILNSSSFVLLRSRILAFWMTLSVPLVVSMLFHFYPLVGPWHPMILTLDYCILETVAIVLALKVFGSYRAALYILLFSLYLNTPVIVTYSGGLHSPSLIFYLFLPFGIFPLTKSFRISMIGLFVGVLEILAIFYLHRSGWSFAEKGIIENYFSQTAGNLLITTAGIWMIALIYSKSLNQVYQEITDAKQFKTVMTLSNRMVEEFEEPLTGLTDRCDSLKNGTLAPENIGTCLNEINGIIFKMSSLISGFRTAAIVKHGER